MSAEEKGGNAEATETQSGGIEQSEKTYTASDVERIVKERLTRQKNTFEKQFTEATQKKGGNANVEDDLRNRLTQYETQTKSLNETLNRYRNSQLKATVEAECAKHGCNDPELLATHFLTKKLVSVDDDDNLVVGNVENSLTELVKAELSKRPHLVRASQSSGLGSKGTGSVQTTGKSPKDMTAAEYEQFKADLGVRTAGPNKLFG
jgi:hypothetical protein